MFHRSRHSRNAQHPVEWAQSRHSLLFAFSPLSADQNFSPGCQARHVALGLGNLTAIAVCRSLERFAAVMWHFWEADLEMSVVDHPDMPAPYGAYSTVIRAVDLLFVAGQAEITPGTNQKAGDDFLA